MKINKITLLIAIMIISILAIGAVSAESVDDATISADDGDLSVATADSEISDVSAVAEDAVDNNPLGEPKTIDINDDTYSTYFDENGMLDSVSDYDTLVVGTLTGKDLKVNKSVTITGNGEGVINNGTITLVDYNAGGTSISGLTINNVNKNAFYIGDLVTNVTIKDNAITIYGDDTTTEYSINGIFTQGFIYDIDIINNTISLSGNFSYMNGFYSSVWDASYNPITTNPGLISLINNTISIDATSTSGSQQGIYFDTFVDSIAQGNVIDIKVTGDTYAYGISLSDSSYSASMADAFDDDYDPTQVLQAPNNITFDGNNITLSTPYMAYGIEAISLGPLDYYDDLDDDGDSYYAEFDNVTITNNNIKAVSERGVYGIVVGGIGDSLISNNYVDVSGSSAEGITSSDMLGQGTAAIAVVMPRSTGKFVSELTISNNIIDSQVSGITVDDDREDVTIENNHILRENGAIIVNDDTYQYLFDEEGNFVYETEDGTTILVDVLTNKNMIFAQPLNIKSKDDSSVITNGTITLTADASGSNVTGLKIVLDNVPAATYPGLAVITLDEGIQDVVLEDNSIQWVTADSPAKATAMGIKIVGGENGVSSDIKLINNEITISGDAANIYGIDCYSNPWDYDGAIINLAVQGNKISLNGNGFVEGIYLSRVTDSEVIANTIEIESAGGNAYAIGTDNIHDVNVEGNTISATTTAEGKTAAGINLYQSDINEKANDITVSGATAQDIKTDAASAVYAIVENDNYDQYFDESGNYINDAENIALGDLSNKDLTFSSPVNVKGALGAKLTDVTIKLTADASGSSIDGLTIVYEGADLSYYHGIIDIMGGAKDIALTNNVINVTATNEDGTAMAIYLSGNTGDDLISNVTISGNEINMNGTAKYLYAVDAISNNWGSDDTAVTGIGAYDNIINLEGTYYVAGFYLSHTADSNIHDNEINGLVTGADSGVAYGIASDCASEMTYDNNIIDLKAVSSSSTVWGIQAAPSYSGTPSTDITVTNNDITVNGASAIGVGINGGNSTIKDNTIDVTAADNETIASISTYDTVGTGNSGVKLTGNATADVSGNYINSNQNNMDLAGAGSDTKIGTNYVTEYVEKEGNPDLPAAPKATSITVQSATVTADPNGKSKTQNIAITVKDANGNPVAGQTIQVYVNGALKTAKTNDKGVATLAVPYKAGGTVSLVASFNGATGLLGSSATGKLTVKKNAVKIAAKTKKVKKSKAKKAKVKITLKVGKTALKKKAVTIKINKKTYKAKTNAKGIATFKVKLPKKAKKYKYTVKFAGDNFNKAKTFKGKLTVK